MLMRTVFTWLLSLFSLTASADTVKPVVPGFSPPLADNPLDEQILQKISRVGWYHLLVEAEGRQPGFAYSLGFYANYGQPEVVVFGLPPAIAQQLLDIVAIRFAGAKQPYELFKPYDDITEDGPVVFVPVARRHFPTYFGYGGWFYQSVDTDFPVIQMVWPDPAGKFPWDAGYNQAYHAFQPVLNE